MTNLNNMTNRTTVARAIAAKHENPNDWMLVVRRFAEALRLDVTRCIVAGLSLELAVVKVLEEAEKQSRTEEQVQAATAAI